MFLIEYWLILVGFIFSVCCSFFLWLVLFPHFLYSFSFCILWLCWWQKLMFSFEILIIVTFLLLLRMKMFYQCVWYGCVFFLRCVVVICIDLCVWYLYVLPVGALWVCLCLGGWFIFMIAMSRRYVGIGLTKYLRGNAMSWKAGWLVYTTTGKLTRVLKSKGFIYVSRRQSDIWCVM